MANTQDFTKFFKDAPFAIDSEAVTTACKTSATFVDRFSGIAVVAANKSNDITTKAVKDTLALLRAVTKVQDEPAEYTKVISDFGTAQAEITKTYFEALGNVAKLAQSDATELFTATGQQFSEQGSKAAKDAGAKAKAAADKAVSAVKAA